MGRGDGEGVHLLPHRGRDVQVDRLRLDGRGLQRPGLLRASPRTARPARRAWSTSSNSLLSAGKSVTIAFSTAADGADVITGHAYTVVSVNADASGRPATVTVRNPWGVTDAAGTGNGYATLTAQQLFDSLLGYVSASV